MRVRAASPTFRGLLPISDNPYFERVGYGVTDGSGEATIALSSAMNLIDAEWSAVGEPPTANVSLQLDAAYVAVQGSNVEFFHYYDQISYNPFTPARLLTASFTLNLTHPYATIPLSNGASSGCGSALSSTWSTVAFSVVPGQLPLTAAIDNASYAPSGTVEFSDTWWLSPSVELGLGGVQSAFPGRVEASVHPAWMGLYPTLGLQLYVTAVITNTTNPMDTGAIGLPTATYLIVDQVQHLHWETGDPCRAFTLNVTYVTSSVALALTGLPVGSSYGCSTIFDGYLVPPDAAESLENLPGQVLLNTTSVPSFGQLQFADLVRPDAGYTLALEAEGHALGTSLVFSINLGDAILAADASEFDCSWICSANPSEEYSSILVGQFGPATSEVPSQGIYAYASLINPPSGSFEIQGIGYGVQFANNSSASVFFYGGLNQTYLDVIGILYPTSVPAIGPVFCRTGDSPGLNC